MDRIIIVYSKEKWIDINIDRENNRALGYNHDSLEDPTNDSSGSFKDYLINIWERVRL